MCCLGFLGLACGIKAEYMLRRASPVETSELKWVDGLIEYRKVPCATKGLRNILHINDNSYISDSTRESELIQAFKGIDIDVEFVD